MPITCTKCHSENPDESKCFNECGLQFDSVDKMPAPPTQTLEVPKEKLTAGSPFAERNQIIEELDRGCEGEVSGITNRF